jgi:hypothetical protein
MWDLTADASAYIEAVHQLSELGAVATQVLKMTSQEGFDAELRLTYMIAVEGDRLSRIEVFDEADLDTALATCEQLSQPSRRLENAASRAEHRLFDHSSIGDWAAITEILAPDSYVDDRRRVVNVGFWDGRDAVIANMRALAEGLAQVSLTVIATRGERLTLTRIRSFNPDSRRGEFAVEMLGIAEIDTDGGIAAHIFFDADDIDAAFEELDARYLAGEAAAHAQTWSVVARAQAGFLRGELPATTPNAVFVDRRSLVASEAVDLDTYLHTVWDLLPDVSVYIEAVHQLTGFGTVVTQTLKGTSQEGFDAEWRMINIYAVERDLISRCETFDEEDLRTALAHFDELNS